MNGLPFPPEQEREGKGEELNQDTPVSWSGGKTKQRQNGGQKA